MNILRAYVALVLSEAVRSKTFSFERFKKLPWRKEEVHPVYGDMLSFPCQLYCELHLTKLGMGTARAVYRYSSSYVLKVAINEKGLAQNEEELSVYTNPETKDIVTKIADCAPDYSWLLSEIVRPVKSHTELLRLLGITRYKTFETNDFQYTFCKLGDVVELAYEKTVQYGDSTIECDEITAALPELARRKIRALEKLFMTNDLGRADIEDIGHWGVTASGSLVLLDYGASMDVLNDHY